MFDLVYRSVELSRIIARGNAWFQLNPFNIGTENALLNYTLGILIQVFRNFYWFSRFVRQYNKNSAHALVAS